MHRRARHAGWRWVVAAGSLCLAGGGAALVIGSLPQTPSAAPLPSRGFGPGLVTSHATAPTPPVDLSVQAVPAGPAPPTDGPRVMVPSLGVDAPWVSERINGRTLGIPSNVHEVGIWDAEDRLAAAQGNVVVAGHVNYFNQGPGALSRLSQVRPGALVYLTNASGASTAWKATSLQIFTKSQLPAVTFSTDGPRQLVLITCGGPFDARDGSYLDNVVVTAAPVPQQHDGNP